MEKIYQKLSHTEHILKLPDTYIGDIQKQKDDLYHLVHNENNIKIQKDEIEYVPGLYKIYDEIIVNSVDHISRLLYIKKKEDVNFYVSKIKVNIDNNKIMMQ